MQSTIIEKAKKIYPKLDRSMILKTNLELSPALSERYQSNVYLKREDLQLVRSFKSRGAYTMMQSLSPEEQSKGVVAASAGNHAQGVALSCASAHIQGTIFMPLTTPSQKVRKTEMFGRGMVTIKLVGDSFHEAYQAACIYAQEQGTIFVHPFDNPDVIAGQGTVGLEIIEQMGTVVPDIALIAVGGGGLIAGVASILKEQYPNIKIRGVESNGSASMTASLQAHQRVDIGKVDTFADGVAVKMPGEMTYAIASELVDDMIVVDDGQTATTMLELLDNQGIITEPAGALAIAALEQRKEAIKNKNLICIVCGGNFDFARLPSVEEKSLRRKGLKRYYLINFPQRPGALKQFLDVLGPDDDIVRFEYVKKTAKESGPALVAIQSNDPKNFDSLMENMASHKIVFEDITDNDLYFNLLV